MFWTTEDTVETFWIRIRKILESLFPKIGDTSKDIINTNLFINLSDPVSFVNVEPRSYPAKFEPNGEIVNYLKNQNFDVIVLDPLSYFYEFEETNTSAVKAFMKAMRKLVSNTQISFILLHHLNKDSQKEKAQAKKTGEESTPNKYWLRGSSAFSAHARHVIITVRNFTQTSDGNQMEIRAYVVKSNFVQEEQIDGLPNGDCIRFEATRSPTNIKKDSSSDNKIVEIHNDENKNKRNDWDDDIF